MGALLGGGEALPIDNMGAMSGAVPEAGTASTLGALSAQGGADPNMGGMVDAFSPQNMSQVQGLLQSLNPVQQVGLQGLLGQLNPIRGGQAQTPTGQPLPVASAAPSSLPQASPPSLPVGQANAPVGMGTTRGGMGAGANAGRVIQQMARQSQSGGQQGSGEQSGMTRMPAPVSQPAPMAYDWSGYRAQARDATEGMNQMPYTFSSYNQIGGRDVSDIMKMFYPGWSPSGAAAPAQDDATKQPTDEDMRGFQPWGF